MKSSLTEPVNRRRSRPLMIASLVFLLAAVAAMALVWRLEQLRLQEYRSHVANIAADHASDLQRRLDHAFSATYALAVLLRQGHGDIADFESVVNHMLPFYPGVSAMQLAPGGVVRQVVPLAGNEGAIGHDILNDRLRAKEARLARDTGKLTLAGPFHLIQGGVGVVARLPVFINNSQGEPDFWGFTNVLVRFPQALDQSRMSQLASRGFGYELWRIHPDTGNKQVIAASSAIASLKEAAEYRISVPNGTWTLSVAPLGGWGSPTLVTLHACLALLISLLLAWLAKLLVEARVHEADLGRLVDERTSELLEIKEQQQTFIEYAPASLAMFDRDMRYLHVSRRWLSDYKLGERDLRGLSHYAVFPEISGKWKEFHRRGLAGEVLRADADCFERVDGTVQWVRWEIRPWRSASGEIGGIVIFSEDITDLKQAEAALRHESDFSVALLNGLPGVFYLYDDQLNFLRWNKTFEQVLGYTGDEIARMSPLDFFAGSDRQLMAERIQQVFDQGESEVEAGFVAKDGTVTPYYFTGLRTNIEGKTCLLGVGIDVTERKKLEEQLLQSQKMEAIGQLAGGVAHDFNNVLQVIMGCGAILMLDEKLDDKQRELLGQIIASSEKAAYLTKGLLAFSRRQTMALRFVDLNGIMRDVQKFLLRIIGEDIQMKLSFYSSVLPVRVDITQIEQVMMNLATNARDAMPKGGLFTIETALQEIDAPFEHAHGYGIPGRYALISVSDTGIGMDEGTLSRLFEPFFTTKETGKGTGLGMAIVYGIIKQHNGYINVYSEPDLGTIFRIYIPLAGTGETAHEESSDDVLPQGGTETILLVEDDADVRYLAVTLLTQFGYNVLEAVDGNEAVEMFAANQEKISLIVMDVIMPKKNGREAYDEICKIRPGVKVLYTSGYTSDFIQSRGVADAGIELIMKPVRSTELLKKIRDMLDSATRT